ncbi:MAG: ATP-dependent zinc metalloprotease FtsH [Alphaproteobacteria bacterium]|nr:ATP-dependent zinc metalloprotease FtsH [Rickettsiales bacterium]
MPLLIYAFGSVSAKKDNKEVRIAPISEFVTMNNHKEITSVKMSQDSLTADAKDGQKLSVSYPMFYSPRLIDDLIKNNVPVTFVGEGGRSNGMKILMIFGQVLSWLPIALMLWLAYGIFKGMNGGGSQGGKGSSGGNGGGFFGSGAFGFGKSKAKVVDGKNLKVTFADVAGIDEAKKDISEIVDFLKDPHRYAKIGGIIPKGCLLIGHPGTGKTLLAKAIASEADVPFFFMSGSDFVEMFVGVGASRVRDLFAQAKRKTPCIVFIDEIDAVGRNRGVGVGGGNDEREQTLNQLLVEMDGFEENNGVIIIAATNRPDVLDPALLRPGRFDRQITISLPDIKGRKNILDVHMKKIKHIPAIDNTVIARGTPGFSGADLANLVNEAALLAARKKKEIVTMDDVEFAKDKILMGSARNTIMKKSEKELTAYHEGGHALLAYELRDISDPIHKITIIPRGMALGMVVRLPKDDQFSVSFEKMTTDIVIALGGRVAEELVFGSNKVTSGASSDIQQVTRVARSMVVKWGLSKKVGLIDYHSGSARDVYSSKLGGDVPYNCSQETAKLIDIEVKRIIDECYDIARKIIKKRKKDLDLIAVTLLEVETLTGEEFDQLIKSGKKPTKSNTKTITKSLLNNIMSGNGLLSSFVTDLGNNDESKDKSSGKSKNINLDNKLNNKDTKLEKNNIPDKRQKTSSKKK